MKSKVIMENGEVEIILTPENDFEIDLIEKISETKKKNFNHLTTFNAEYNYGIYQKHHISINIKETK